MPIFNYLCSHCGHKWEEIGSAKDFTRYMSCPGCGKQAEKNFGGAKVVVFSEKERFSIAMGVHPSQIPAAMRAYPGSEYNEKGYLRVRGRTDKKKKMKQRGYIEYD